MGKEALLNQSFGRNRRGAVQIIIHIKCQPVTVVPTGSPEVIFRLIGHIVDPTFHTGILIDKNLFVAVCKIMLPRNDCRRICPSGTTGTVFIKGIRNDIRYPTVTHLIGRDILKPFAEEVFYPSIECSCAEEYMCITHPAESFIPLRTVGRDIHIIAMHTPTYIALQLIDRIIRAFESAVVVETGIDHRSGEVFWCKFAIPSIYHDVTEAVESKAWFKDIITSTADEPACGFSATKIMSIEIALFIEHFCMTNRDLLSLRTSHGDNFPSYKILSEINYFLALGCGEHLDGLNHLTSYDRL